MSLVNSVNLREVKRKDCRSIWLWANDAGTRDASLDSNPILWSQHVLWFEHLLKVSPRSIAIAVIEPGNSIAMVRCAVNHHIGELSINISPDWRGCGFGKQILALAIPYFFQLFDLGSLIAKIKPFNLASLRIFRQAGFVEPTKNSTLDAFAKTPQYLVLIKKRDGLTEVQ